ncbi:MAG: hypothetical protein GY822_29530 [Deltaproteobacteria bacterium]|nr:hypothetical protein [Deltaproteobacteria bacterium]
MKALWTFFSNFSFGLGNRRIFIRRLASIALVLLGVHAAAHTIDAAIFGAIDRSDLVIDQFVWALFEWISGMGGLSAKNALDYAETFSTAVDLEQKEYLAHALALIAELLIDFLLLDLVWGTRHPLSDEEQALGPIEELKQSTRILKDALWPLDLERFAAPLVLFFFTLAGALSTGIAVEGALHSFVSNLVPLWRWSINFSAAAGLLFVALLVARFLPDLLFGGALRASERSVEAAEKWRIKLEKGPPPKTGESAVVRLRRQLPLLLRGWSVAFILLPLSLVGLFSQEIFLQLVQRTRANL